MRFCFQLILFILISPILSIGQGIIINAGTTIVNTNNLITKNNFINNGLYSDNSGTVTFSGLTQQIAGISPTSFNNITISSGSTTTINSSGHSLQGTLLSNGTLNASGNITLLSTAAKTALIDGSGSGIVNGNITMQRYLPSGFGYKYVSSPFQSAVVGEFSDDMDLTATFPTFYYYDETQNNTGWISYVNAASTLNPMRGYAANFGSDLLSKIIDVSGEVNNGSMQVNLFNNNKTYTKGFNLVGNPYPSPIDWDAASGWDKINIDDAVYYFDAGNTNQYKGTYSSYVNGVSSNGIANNIISSMQGFFVHVSDGAYPVSATLGFSNAIRINNLNPSFHKSNIRNDIPLIRIAASYKDYPAGVDPSVVYFVDESSVRFENKWDALKIMNTDDYVPNIYIVSSNNAKQSIAAMPYPEDDLTLIPLGVLSKRKAWMRLFLKETINIPEDVFLYLYDVKTGYHPLRDQQECLVYLDSNEYKGRFYLVFSKKDIQYIPEESDMFYAYTSNAKLFVYLSNQVALESNLYVRNLLGQVVFNKKISGLGYHEIDLNLNTGIYIIQLESNNNKYSKKVFVSDNIE